VTTEELKDYNNLVAILNEVIEGWEKLDEYRKEKNPAEKMKKLFTVHEHENKAKRMVKQEVERQESKTQQNKAA
jgi:hypothetical protein